MLLYQSFTDDDGNKFQFPQTIHELYAHLPQLIAKNNGHGLGAFSEENTEAMHQYLRYTRTRKCRQFSQEDNLTDIIIKANVRSDPKVNSLKKQNYVCSKCGGVGHNVRTCNLLDKEVEEELEADYESDEDEERVFVKDFGESDDDIEDYGREEMESSSEESSDVEKDAPSKKGAVAKKPRS